MQPAFFCECYQSVCSLALIPPHTDRESRLSRRGTWLDLLSSIKLYILHRIASSKE